MGKRGRQEEEEEQQPEQEAAPAEEVVAAAPAAETGGGDGAPEDGDGGEGGGRRSFGRRGQSQVNPETATYLEEVVAHYKTLVDDDERALLVGNVLEEIAGKEVTVAGDPVCSRHVETLMASAQAAQLLRFLTSVSDVDGFFTLVSNPFGSHAVEKLLVRLESQLEGMQEEEYGEFERVMTLLTDSICPHLYDYATDRFATHVARRLLCLLAGRNVLPPPGKAKQQAQALPGLGNKRQKGEPATGLAAKLGPGGGTAAAGHGHGKAAAMAMAAELLGSGADEPPPCRLPEQVAKFVAAVCSDGCVGAMVAEMVYHTYACPFLQALLRAAASDRKSLRTLVPVLLGATSFNDSSKGGAGAVLEGCKDEEVAELFVDPTTSHLVEVMLQVLPKSLLEEFVKRFLAPRLAELAQHGSANFVVQAALASTPSKDMAKTMYDSLGGLLPDLLRMRRSGVVAALAACLGRHGVCQKEACAALAGALSGLPQWAHLQGDASLAPALLCLDSLPVVGSNDPFTPASVAAARGGNNSQRLSPVGCSILIQVLRYGQGACRAFTDSVAALQPHDAARVGADPSGSRVLEALLEGNAPAKVKNALLTSLGGHWDAVAATASGSFLVESAYRWAELPAKEAIVSRLAAATRQLEGTHWGPALLRKVGSEAYARDPEQWRRHASSASKTMDQFSKLFGGFGAFGGDGGEGGKGRGKGGREEGPSGRGPTAAGGGGGGGSGGEKVVDEVKVEVAEAKEEAGKEEEEREAKRARKEKKKQRKEKERAEAGAGEGKEEEPEVEEAGVSGREGAPVGVAKEEAEVEEAGRPKKGKKGKRKSEAVEAAVVVVEEEAEAIGTEPKKKGKKKAKEEVGGKRQAEASVEGGQLEDGEGGGMVLFAAKGGKKKKAKQ